MKTLRLILNQMVDLLFGFITLGLAIWYCIDTTKNFTMFLFVVVGYVANVVINKVRIIKRDEYLNRLK